MIAWFVVGGVLALGALAFVLLPIVRGVGDASWGASAALGDDGDDAITALREVEFDRATGKLSDDDYATLSARYRPQALAQLAREGAGAADDARDPEAMIAAWRGRDASCATCGPRPEAGAAWCSTCGGYLSGRCARCRAEVTEAGASYCSHCGAGLAAA